jgi:acetyltransferase-like isoleucine patch superfamily enzyme
MLKKVTEILIRKRNPQFVFDENSSSGMISSVAYTYFLSWMRGLRLLFFLRNPKMICLGRGVRFKNLSRICFGKKVQLGELTTLSAFGTEGIYIGNHVSIGAFCRLIVSTSLNNIGKHIRIGNNVGIGEFAYLGGAGGLKIGDECIIGQYFSCHPENHVFEKENIPFRFQGVTRKGITIGKNCWIGAKVTVLDGVTIGDNCVIAAGAVVTKDIPPCSVAAGVPARVLRGISKKIKEEKSENLKLSLFYQ